MQTCNPKKVRIAKKTRNNSIQKTMKNGFYLPSFLVHSVLILVCMCFTVNSAYGLISVLDYGATGDGSTDDTSAIQSALNAAGAYDDTVLFPAGTYIVSDTLKVPSGITVQGEGHSSIIKLGDNSTVGNDPSGGTVYSVITNANWTACLWDIKIRDIAIDANKFNNAQDMRGIILYNVKRALIDNVLVMKTKTYHGIYLSQVSYATVSNCIVTNFDGDGICLQKSGFCTISNNHVYEGGWAGGVGIELEGRSGTNFSNYRNYAISVVGNTIHNISGHGILVIGTDWFSLSANTIYMVQANGIEILGAKFGAITGNSIGDVSMLLEGSSTRSGIKITPEYYGSIGKSQAISITGNICNYAVDYGIHVQGESDNLHSYITVCSNITNNNTNGGIKAEYVSGFNEEGNVMIESTKLIIGSGVTYQAKFRTRAGTPNGYIVPYYIGEELLDTTNLKWYKSCGTTNSSWVSLN